MCGVNGIFSVNSISKIEERIVSMNDSIKHRGPDASGYEIFDDGSAFGHDRLKIIDLSDKSNQPMTNTKEKISVVFNGEIYNFEQIKKELHYNFKTHSDTEVILAAIIERGIDWFLKRANGMFAIAVYYIDKKELHLLRDRLGIKPLYYYHDLEKIIFSSEIKGILNSGLIEPEFNFAAIDPYLANRYVVEPYTFFKGIYQVESSQHLTVNLGDEISINRNKYWNLPKLNFDKEYNESDILKKLDEEITKSVKLQLISDVSLGTYLSGGLDSSLLTAITSRESAKKINTYTIGFPENGYNEFEYSDIVAREYNTIHHKIEITPVEFLKKWEELIFFRDAPIGVPNEIPLSIMSKVLKDEITVVLSGEGADELFGGYGRIFRFPFYYEKKIKNSKNFYASFIEEYEYVPRSFRNAYLNLDISIRNELDKKNTKMFHGLRNEEKIFNFFHNVHIKGLLMRLDAATMQSAVEGRVPFLDHKLIEFVYEKIPYELKIKWKSAKHEKESANLRPEEFSENNDIPKYILKKLSYNYLPSKIIERRKVGFPVPLAECFSDIISHHLDLLKNADWIRQEKIDELILSARNHDRSGQILWMLVNVELFRHTYFSKKWLW
ncbi:MAG: Asparagine synthetase [Candidatus Moranbacteria bacterium GW2011_GWE1_35_17]|nr:MAG: Asparagine synthetase [Candidatus Moranbacteria bacterium GW2011_GWE1_35_17]KKP89568.1 MAG: Asparagine synthetase [Parcubacteria group bacterium GW2011_GWC1_36_108]HCU01663.1 asparagine synthase (glutamine-hydrolyzing) [Candidatus Nomurabacteria bacterium]